MQDPADQSAPYNMDRWGDGYFRVGDDGRLLVRPDPDGTAEAPLEAVHQACRGRGMRDPILVRFSGILRHRVRRLENAFDHAIHSADFNGQYQPVYPIKVNQQRRVVEELLNANTPNRLGLEAGSKPELLAVMALSDGHDATIVCNGYKDQAYIRLALIATRLGFRVWLVVEKLSELQEIIEQAAELDVRPRIGLRVRLLSIGDGHWQNTGGEKSKFGLSAPQVQQALELCHGAGQLNAVQMLHFHLGSQVANLAEIATGVREAARYYQSLRAWGAPLSVLDVGGGLGVDYDGTGSGSRCSMDYGLHDYADTIVRTLRECCQQHGLPEPNLVSESGRALTAHHAVVLTRIIDREVLREASPATDNPEPDTKLPDLQALHAESVAPQRDPGLLYDQLTARFTAAQQDFVAGRLNFEHRAEAERLYNTALLRLHRQLDAAQHPDLSGRLDEQLADRLFVNFSIFQSVPDVWGINQIFPVLPVRGLDNTPNTHALVRDITCDSDGRMDLYPTREGVVPTLPLTDDGDPDLAFFMVGAYQEILGDRHNLFGDSDAVDIEIGEDGGIRLDHAVSGDTVDDLLRYVDYDPAVVLTKLERHCNRAGLGSEERARLLTEIRAGLRGYSYLEPT